MGFVLDAQPEWLLLLSSCSGLCAASRMGVVENMYIGHDLVSVLFFTVVQCVLIIFTHLTPTLPRPTLFSTHPTLNPPFIKTLQIKKPFVLSS